MPLGYCEISFSVLFPPLSHTSACRSIISVAICRSPRLYLCRDFFFLSLICLSSLGFVSLVRCPPRSCIGRIASLAAGPKSPSLIFRLSEIFDIQRLLNRAACADPRCGCYHRLSHSSLSPSVGGQARLGVGSTLSGRSIYISSLPRSPTNSRLLVTSPRSLNGT